MLDTSDRSIHQLRGEIERAFATGGDLDGRPVLRATIVSFGYKYGLPVDADLVVDVRFLPNPFWIPELREQTGETAEVRDYVLSQQGAQRVRRPLRRDPGDHRRRVHPRGQALPDPRGGMHRRQTPLRRHGAEFADRLTQHGGSGHRGESGPRA